MAENVKVAVRVRPFISSHRSYVVFQHSCLILKGINCSERARWGVLSLFWTFLDRLLHNSREKQRNATIIIDMQGKSTTIKDPSAPEIEPKKFTFDYSYWSHDGFVERDDGYLAASTADYADQVRCSCLVEKLRHIIGAMATWRGAGYATN